MDRINITNRELYIKIMSELGDMYRIGLHESTKFCYKNRRKFDEMYYIDNDVVNEDEIILNILKKGLCIPDRYVGITSTVTFFDKISIDCFNYSYYQYLGSNKCYVLIVAIPKCIEIDGKKYCIKDMIEYIDITNFSLFNVLLPKEFIYGYYAKNVSYEMKGLNDEEGYYECIFDDKMDFYLNDNFYGYMSKEMQKCFWNKYFNDNKIDISFFKYESNLSKVRRIVNKYNNR